MNPQTYNAVLVGTIAGVAYIVGCFVGYFIARRRIAATSGQEK